MHILKCEVCGSYGLKPVCECGGKRFRVKPARFSLKDAYAKYRRQYKLLNAMPGKALGKAIDKTLNKV